jgi:hypothetical protein
MPGPCRRLQSAAVVSLPVAGVPSPGPLRFPSRELGQRAELTRFMTSLARGHIIIVPLCARSRGVDTPASIR